MPPHLYGQLSLAKGGLDLLEKDPAVNSVIRFLVEKSQCYEPVIHVPSAAEWVKVKACMWAVANIALSARGAAWVDARGGLNALVDFAEKCNVFSLKATAFYAIGLVATTRVGCKVLATRGWYSLRHGRDERWPVLEDWFGSSTSQPVLPTDRQKQNEGGRGNDQDSDISTSIGTSIDESKLESMFLTGGGGGSLTESSSPVKEFMTSVSSRKSTPQRPDPASGDVSMRQRGNSISSRKRLSNIFRSWSIGSSSSDHKKAVDLSPGQQPPDQDTNPPKRRSSFSAKIKRNLFPSRPSTAPANQSAIGQLDTAEATERGSFEEISKPDKSAAPIATPENSSPDDDGQVDSSGPKQIGVEVHATSTPESGSLGTAAAASVVKTRHLSPIPSTTSIAGAGEVDKAAEQSASAAATAGVVQKVYPQLPVGFPSGFKRNSQRAFSESEAQNASYRLPLLFATVAGPVHGGPGVGAGAGVSNRSAWSESGGSARGTARAHVYQQVPRISLISGAVHQPAHYQPTLHQGTSMASVSSAGSWVDPGFYTLRYA